jgi:hypothetical protein
LSAVSAFQIYLKVTHAANEQLYLSPVPALFCIKFTSRNTVPQALQENYSIAAASQQYRSNIDIAGVLRIAATLLSLALWSKQQATSAPASLIRAALHQPPPLNTATTATTATTS